MNAINTQSPTSLRGMGLVIALTLAAVLPFVGKAYHIDDPTYLWTAEQLLKHPLDFYGYTINWYGEPKPMHEEMQNPPLTGYYIALVSLAVGFNEVGQHLAFALWTVGLALGVFVLARKWNAPPTLSALVTVFTPGVLVSATNVMCDVMLTCLWVWAIVLWEYGLGSEKRRWGALIGAGLCIAAAALTKYFGFALVPLLAVHGLMRMRRPGLWLCALLIPVAVLAVYEWWAHRLYGHGLILGAALFSSEYRVSGGVGYMFVHTAIGLAFTGGCAASVLFFWPRLWPQWAVVFSLIAMAVIALAIGAPGVDTDNVESIARVNWISTLQAALWIVVGTGALLLPILELRKRGDAVTVTLFLWVWGTFIFSAYLNWSVTGRTILPMIPAIGLLVARRIQRETQQPQKTAEDRTIILPLAMAAALALYVTYGDFRLANSARIAAQHMVQAYGGNGSLWFQGHWGFQYYMQRDGAGPVNHADMKLEPGEHMVIPRNNCNIHEPTRLGVDRIDQLQIALHSWVTTNRRQLGAGFYASVIGSLPFAFGQVPTEEYDVFALHKGNIGPSQ